MERTKAYDLRNTVLLFTLIINALNCIAQTETLPASVPDKVSHFVNWQINTSFHYTMGTGHFIGIEINKEINRGRFEMALRPQAKIKINCLDASIRGIW